MPRRPRHQAMPDEALTPFARLLRRWMWEQRPPWTMADLADRSGLSRTSIWNWFGKGAAPRAAGVRRVAVVTGIPFAELAEAAGLPAEAEAGEEGDDPYGAILAVVRAVAGLPPPARVALAAEVERVRARHPARPRAGTGGDEGREGAGGVAWRT